MGISLYGWREKPQYVQAPCSRVAAHRVSRVRKPRSHELRQHRVLLLKELWDTSPRLHAYSGMVQPFDCGDRSPVCSYELLGRWVRRPNETVRPCRSHTFPRQRFPPKRAAAVSPPQSTGRKRKNTVGCGRMTHNTIHGVLCAISPALPLYLLKFLLEKGMNTRFLCETHVERNGGE